MKDKLKRFLEILNRRAWERLQEELTEYPAGRSMLLCFAKERIPFYIHLTLDGPRVLLTEPTTHATLKVFLDVNTFFDILKGRYSPDYAVSKGWIVLDSDSEEGWFYHYTCVRRYFNHVITAYKEAR